MWHDMRTDPPKEERAYLTVAEDGCVAVHTYCDGWNCHRSYITGELVRDCEIDSIRFWAELPEPPAGYTLSETGLWYEKEEM